MGDKTATTAARHPFSRKSSSLVSALGASACGGGGEGASSGDGGVVDHPIAYTLLRGFARLGTPRRLIEQGEMAS